VYRINKTKGKGKERKQFCAPPPLVFKMGEKNKISGKDMQGVGEK